MVMRARTSALELFVGLFMLAGMLALLVLALKVSGLSSYVGHEGYVVTADFDNVGSLKARAPVTVAGVRVGEVTNIQLDRTTFKALVTMQINPDENTLPTDTSASILTQGLLGSNYISLTPGFNDTFLKNGNEIENTHSALILEDLIGELVFSLKNSDKK
jgi:phospholipid/cholesterol/gamma-HCH transport system substrate-binding protein